VVKIESSIYLFNRGSGPMHLVEGLQCNSVTQHFWFFEFLKKVGFFVVPIQQSLESLSFLSNPGI
jgi:hypothetical protein